MVMDMMGGGDDMDDSSSTATGATCGSSASTMNSYRQMELALHNAGRSDHTDAYTKQTWDETTNSWTKKHTAANTAEHYDSRLAMGAYVESGLMAAANSGADHGGADHVVTDGVSDV